jgi:hypothetical protein
MAVCGPGTRGLRDTLDARYWRPLTIGTQQKEFV